MPNNTHHIANRQSEVWGYLCQGKTRQDIATALKIAGTIGRDIEYLTLIFRWQSSCIII